MNVIYRSPLGSEFGFVKLQTRGPRATRSKLLHRLGFLLKLRGSHELMHSHSTAQGVNESDLFALESHRPG